MLPAIGTWTSLQLALVQKLICDCSAVAGASASGCGLGWTSRGEMDEAQLTPPRFGRRARERCALRAQPPPEVRGAAERSAEQLVGAGPGTAAFARVASLY